MIGKRKRWTRMIAFMLSIVLLVVFNSGFTVTTGLLTLDPSDLTEDTEDKYQGQDELYFKTRNRDVVRELYTMVKDSLTKLQVKKVLGKVTFSHNEAEFLIYVQPDTNFTVMQTWAYVGTGPVPMADGLMPVPQKFPFYKEFDPPVGNHLISIDIFSELVGYRFPVELYLYTKLPSDQLMTAYKMACLDYPSSADEVYGTNMTTFESYYATVLTNKFRVEVFDGEQFYEIGIEPAIGPSGKMNFASAGGGWVPQKPGAHRIYFYLNDPLITMANAIINNDEHYVFSLGLMAEGLSSKKEGVSYINGQWTTWIDVDVKLPNSNGGRK